MTHSLNRRRFLQMSGLGLALTTFGPATARANQRTFEISLNELSLERSIREQRIRHLDFARLARRQADLTAVEYASRFFQDQARNPAFLAEMNRRAADEGVRQLLIVVENEGSLADADSSQRRLAVDHHRRWLDAARTLGCHSIQVRVRGEGNADRQQKQAAEALSGLCDHADALRLNVLVENAGGLSADPQWLSGLLQLVDRTCCRAAVRFDGFDAADRYEGMARLAPLAKAVRAVAHDFDEDGNEKHTDYLRMIKLILDAGYRGYVGIQYQGSDLDELAGIRATRMLLDRVRRREQAAAPQ